jgi:rubrerythrin
MKTVREEVVRSQHRILDTIEECEILVAMMYEKFAAAMPVLSGFWSELAADERRHAKVLKALHTILDRGHLFHGIGRFDQAKITEVRHFLARVDRRVAKGRLTRLDAAASALRVECMLVDGRFYSTVTTDAPEFLAVCKMLQKEEERHLARLNEAFHDDLLVKGPDFWARFGE